MMETARDLNMETDEMQLVISALRGVGKRIVEVAQTRASVYQSPHFTGLPRQENHSLHAVCREDTLPTLRHKPTIAKELSKIKPSQGTFPADLFVFLVKNE